MEIYIIGGILVLLIIYVLITRNKIVKLNNKVKEAFATMDVSLKKRWDLIPNIVSSVKGYVNYEKEVLSDITKLRSGLYDTMKDEEKLSVNTKINEEMPRIMALKEAYPELKANENFLNLSEALIKVEDEIAKSRRYFNATVRDYNNFIETVPSNIIVKIFGYQSKKMFAAKEEEKENVKVEI